MAVGAALVSLYPANLNAITAASPYGKSALAEPQMVARAIAQRTGAFKENDLSIEEPEAIDIWLDKLAFKESRNRADVKVLDVNGEFSYGCLQFQERTFRSFGERYGLVPAGANITTLIYNCELQKEIAKRMLEENPGNWRAWYTSVKSSLVGKPPKIA